MTKQKKYFIKKRAVFLGIDGTTIKLRVEANPEEYYIRQEGVSSDTSKYDGHAYYCEIDMSKNINLDDFFIELIPFKQ